VDAVVYTVLVLATRAVRLGDVRSVVGLAMERRRARNAAA
jgi:hypothetical protein